MLLLLTLVLLINQDLALSTIKSQVHFQFFSARPGGICSELVMRQIGLLYDTRLFFSDQILVLLASSLALVVVLLLLDQTQGRPISQLTRLQIIFYDPLTTNCRRSKPPLTSTDASKPLLLFCCFSRDKEPSLNSKGVLA